ncbi:MAG: cytochrome c family protein [Candidatus Eisenbacteria bacterium]
MKRASIITAFVVVSIMLVAWPSKEKEVEHPKPSYVGAGRCKVCHLDTYNSWKTTIHARSLSTLKAEDAQDSTCLRCHTTGFGDGGYGAKVNIIDLAGVQCEACHGAGSLYSRSSVMRQPDISRELGLVAVDSTTCTTCHNDKSPTFKGFAYKAGLLTATHTLKSGRRATVR